MDMIDRGSRLEINGERFGKLSPRDRAVLLAPERMARRGRFKSDLKDAVVTGQEYINELDAFDQMNFGDAEWFKFINTIEGRSQTIARACEKENPADKVDAILEKLSVDLDDDFLMAVKLSGVKLAAPDEEKQKAMIAREKFKSDLRAAGLAGDDFLAKLAEFDASNDLEVADPRPSVAGSSAP